MAEFIRRLTREGDRIAVLGSEPEIFFLANRRSATGFHLHVPARRSARAFRADAREAIEEIESAAPEFIVLVDVETSWLDSSLFKRLSWRDGEMMTWFRRYQPAFELSYAVELTPAGPRRFAGRELGLYRARPGRSIEVYRRRL